MRSGDASEAGSPATGCYTSSGAGSTKVCRYTLQTTAGYRCPSDAGATLGSCPSSGLQGCCVETLTGDGGATESAVCYYDATAAQSAAMQCSFEAYQGMPYNWQTAAP